MATRLTYWCLIIALLLRKAGSRLVQRSSMYICISSSDYDPWFQSFTLCLQPQSTLRPRFALLSHLHKDRITSTYDAEGRERGARVLAAGRARYEGSHLFPIRTHLPSSPKRAPPRSPPPIPNSYNISISAATDARSELLRLRRTRGGGEEGRGRLAGGVGRGEEEG